MSQWDGDYIGRTKDCNKECPFYLAFPYAYLGAREQVEICNWGMALKRLIEVERPRKCGKNRDESPRDFERTQEDITIRLQQVDQLNRKREARREKAYHQNYGQLKFDFVQNVTVIDAKRRLREYIEEHVSWEVRINNPNLKLRVPLTYRQGTYDIFPKTDYP